MRGTQRQTAMRKPQLAVLTAEAARGLLEDEANPDAARQMRRFFKTGPGGYAQGDIFWGVVAPRMRAVAAAAAALPLAEVERLLDDPVHEVRACALAILTLRFRKGNETQRREIIRLYLRRTDCVNNWDLVDNSAGMLGEWLRCRNRAVLRRLADSSVMWEQRIAIVATLPLIRAGEYADILDLAARLRRHPHDLMRKAIGWMLREVGKRDKAALEGFLKAHLRDLSRTTLRYAIERFPEAERQAWLRR